MTVGLDRTIIELARDGDQDAREAVVRDAAQRLHPLALRITRDRDLADDAVQRTLVAIWRELPKLRDSERYEGWSYRILQRFCTDELRRRGAARTAALEPDLLPAPDRPSVIVQRDQLERALAGLSADHRAVVALTYYRGLTGSEAAAALGVSAGTIASRLHYALRSMRAMIDADDRAIAPAVLAGSSTSSFVSSAAGR
jgi:RNA polymerase sigma-70 factor, ECF subfamily